MPEVSPSGNPGSCEGVLEHSLDFAGRKSVPATWKQECKGKQPETHQGLPSDDSGEHWEGNHTLEELSEVQGKILCHEIPAGIPGCQVEGSCAGQACSRACPWQRILQVISRG